MTLRLLFLLLIAAPTTRAQDSLPRPGGVAERYHRAAGLFVDGRNAEAEAVAEDALALAPTDRKLKALLDAIRQDTPDAPDSGGGGGDDSAEGQSEPNDGDTAGQPPEEPSSETPSENGRGESDAESLQDDQAADADATGAQQPDGTDERPGPDAEPDPTAGGASTATPADAAPGPMTRAEAQRLLGALDADEEALLQQVQRRNTPPRRVQKDW